MKREKIKTKNTDIDDFDDDVSWEFEFIDRDIISFDAEKCYIDVVAIYKRISDGKYFKVEYSEFTGDSDFSKQTLIEVFPRTIEKVIYE